MESRPFGPAQASAVLQKRFRFVAALAVLLLCGFLATSLISFFVARRSISHRIASESLPLTSDNVYSEIQRDLLRSVLVSSMMAHDTFVHEWIDEGEQDPQRMVRFLNEVRSKHHTISAFFVSERTRRYYHADGVLKTVSRSDPIDGWYFRVRKMSAPYEINVDTDTADHSRLDIFVNYRVTEAGGKFLGAIGVGLAVDTVRSLIESYQRRFGRQIYFVDRAGKVTLYGSSFTGPLDIRDRPGLAPHAAKLLGSEESSFSYRDADGHHAYLNARLVPQFDWYLVVAQREDPAEAVISRTLLVNILISLLITALVLVLSHWLIRGYQGRLEAMATTDKLTGAANRHIFELLFDKAVKTARRRDEPLSLLSLDVDHFKRINDRFGHVFGDVALKTVVDIVRRQTRESDVLCRWGGDEFLLLMPNATASEAAVRAEAIREAVRGHDIRVGQDSTRTSVSMSVAEFRPGEGLDALLRRMDASLYQAKRAGRDQVSGQGAPPAPPDA